MTVVKIVNQVTHDIPDGGSTTVTQVVDSSLKYVTEGTYQEYKSGQNQINDDILVALDGYTSDSEFVRKPTFQENKVAQGEINDAILVALDGYGQGGTEQEHSGQQAEINDAILQALDGYAQNQTITEHYNQQGQINQSILQELDGYAQNQTITEHHNQQEQINQSILQSLDGYVPYIGATNDVNLGNHTLSATGSSDYSDAITATGGAISGNGIDGYATGNGNGGYFVGSQVPLINVSFSGGSPGAGVVGIGNINQGHGGFFTAGNNSAGVYAQGTGNGAGILAYAGASGGSGVEGTGGPSYPGAYFTGGSNAHGAIAEGGANGTGIMGVGGIGDTIGGEFYASGDGTALVAYADTGLAGDFEGNVLVNGSVNITSDISVGGNLINKDLTETFSVIRQELDGYGSSITGINNTVTEHYNQQGQINQSILQELDGYAFAINGLNNTVTENNNAQQDINDSILQNLDGYSLSVDLIGLNNTVTEHYNQQGQINQNVLQSLDGYGGGLTSEEGSDGYIAFFIRSTHIEGDNDLYWDRAANQLRVDGYIYPTTDNLHDLGKSTNRWHDLWLGGGSLHLRQSASENDLGTEREINIGINDVGALIVRQASDNLIQISNDAIAIGFAASVFENNGIAIGKNALAIDGNSIVIGNGATAGTYFTTNTGISIGNSSGASSNGAISLGNGTTSTGDYSIAIGEGATADELSIAIGQSALCRNGFPGNIAIGYNTDTNAFSDVLLIGYDIEAIENNYGQIGSVTHPISINTYSYLKIGTDGYLGTQGGDLYLNPVGNNVVPGNVLVGLGNPDNRWADGYFNDLNTSGIVEGIINIDASDTPFLARQNDHTILADTTGGDIIINLPAAGASNKGRIYCFKKLDSTALSSVTIVPSGTEKIDGDTSLVLNVQYQSREIQSDGNNWWIFSGLL